MIFVLLFLLLLILFAFLPGYLTHIEMNKSTLCSYRFITFTSFFKKFNQCILDHPKLEWTYFYGSFFAKDMSNTDSEGEYWLKPYKIYMHASIIRIDDMCYIMDPISWISYNFWMKKHAKGYIEQFFGEIGNRRYWIKRSWSSFFWLSTH